MQGSSEGTVMDTVHLSWAGHRFGHPNRPLPVFEFLAWPGKGRIKVKEKVGNIGLLSGDLLRGKKE